MKDIIGLETEKLGEPLLIKMIQKGKLIYKLPTLDEIKKNVKNKIDQLPKRYLEINKVYPFDIKISKGLRQLFENVKKKHIK